MLGLKLICLKNNVSNKKKIMPSLPSRTQSKRMVVGIYFHYIYGGETQKQKCNLSKCHELKIT